MKNKLNINKKMLMKISLIVTAFLMLNYIKSEDESWMKEIEFDGVVLKINERIFQNMMKKINYAIVLFYEDKDKQSDIVQNHYRLAAESIVQISPAVGVFKMKCSENPRFCSELKKEEIPFLIWINNNNFGIYNEPKDKESFINFCEKMVKFSSIKVLDSKEDIVEFLMNNNYYRLLGVFPRKSNETSLNEDLYENSIPNSIIANSGEFIFGKVITKELTEYIYREFNRDNDSLLIYTKADLLNFTNIFKIDEETFKRNKKKYTFISEFTNEKFFPYYFNPSISDYYENTTYIINDITLNALPSIFPLDQKFYNLAFGGPIQKHFLLIIHPDHLLNFQILENYSNISSKFREKKYEIWFTFSLFDNELKDTLKPELTEINKDEEKDFPILLLFNMKNYETNKKDDAEKYFFNKKITFQNLENFYLKFHKIDKFDEIKHTLKSELNPNQDYHSFKQSNLIDIPKTTGSNFKELVLDFPDNVLVFYFDNDRENVNLYRKWIFLLHKILKISNPDLLRIYKYNVDLNDMYLTQLPHNLPAIRLYIRHNKDNPIEYLYGPSILNIAKYLNELIPLLNLKISLMEAQEYNQEIFSNPDYMEEKIYEIDDDGKEHLINSNQAQILEKRGLDSKIFKSEDNLNETLKEFIETEQIKSNTKQKFDL